MILTGPYFPESDRAELERTAGRRTDMRTLSFLPETAPLLERADQIVAMGGYNTVMEVLSYRKRALIVPRVSPGPSSWSGPRSSLNWATLTCCIPTS
ncbi:glycosyltransferase [Deinococcus malanensis]|uniref:glycosyltransferase n=1 Tax=Deinococcus malanensis TaxID=1706855 RepID=UPI003630A0A5